MPLTAAGQAPALAIAVAGPSALVAAEAGTILRTMRDLIEAHTPGVLPPIDRRRAAAGDVRHDRTTRAR